MPVNLDKESYNPEEVHDLISEHLGEDAAQQFRLYFNKVQKLPPHNIEVHKLRESGDDMFEYRFKMEEYAQKIGIPAEVLKFVMVPSERHGGGSQDNMGWLRIKFKNITSPMGNTVHVAILDEIQSDFSQRISRIRQLLNGKATEDELTPTERAAWRAIKNNSELVEPNNADKEAAPEGVQKPQPWNVPVLSIPPWEISYDSEKQLADVKLNNKLIASINLVGTFNYTNDCTPQEQEQFRKNTEVLWPKIVEYIQHMIKPKEENKSEFKATQLLKGIINKIESTSYSDILKYLFNKAVGFSKQKGAQQLWVPSSEMKMQQWKGNAQHGAENLINLFKKVYDDNSVTYQAVRDLEKSITGQDFWVIELGAIQDTRLAMLKLSNNWKSKDGMDRTNWKFYFDTYYKSYMQNYNPDMEEDKKNEEHEGGVAYHDGPDARMYEIMETFIDNMIPQQAYGDIGFVQDFKNYLKANYKFDLPPEFESKLLHDNQEGSGGWRPVQKAIPKQETDLDAPSVSDLNNMFKINRFSKAFKNTIKPKDEKK